MRDIKFFASYYAAIKELPDNKQGEVYKAVFDYAMEGIEPSNLSGLSLAVFNLIKPYLDSSKKQYENGIKGGRPARESQKQSEEETQSETQTITQDETQEQSQRQTIKNKNKDIDIYKKEINKERKNTILTDSELNSLIEDNFKDEEVCQKFKGYVEMRKAMGKNKAIRTKSTFDSCISKLRKYALNKQEAIEVLDNSIANCYQGLFDIFGHCKAQPKDREAIPYAN